MMLSRPFGFLYILAWGPGCAGEQVGEALSFSVTADLAERLRPLGLTAQAYVDDTHYWVSDLEAPGLFPARPS